MSQGESFATDFLEHQGVKGMKWGVRKDRGHEGERVKTKKLAKLDRKFDKQFEGVHGFVKMQNAVADKINPRLQELNAKPKYQGNLLEKPAVHKQYLKEYEGLLKKSLEDVSNDFGTNPSGTKRVNLTMQGKGAEAYWHASWEDVKHASAADSFNVKPMFDSSGKITGTKFVLDENELKQDAFVDEFLAHYGVKGMKWGVRRAPQRVKVRTQAVPGRKVKASGGTGQKASKDAVRTAVYKQKARKSTTDSLSNKELKDLVNRMSLEKQYREIMASTNPNLAAKAGKFVKSFLGLGKTANEIEAFRNSPAGKRLASQLNS